MLSFWQTRVDSAQRFSRREVLRLGSLGFGTLSLADLFRLRAQGGTNEAAADTAVIHVFLGGGPSHIDTFDLKPDAPAEIRGEFRPIPTSLPGYSICEHLPYLAQTLQRMAVVRSISHSEPSHLPASHWVMTGYRPTVSAPRNFQPYCGAIVAKERGANVEGMPAYVGIPKRQIFGGAAYLGSAFNPFTTNSEPNADDYRVRPLYLPEEIDADRLRDRQALRNDLERLQANVDQQSRNGSFDRFSEAAVEMVTNARVRKAFDIGLEPAAVRDQYGRTTTGQRCLLARRLVEAGVTFVTVLSGGEWDTHTANFEILKNKSLPLLDRAVAALVTDLYERGLDRRVLLVVSGEFGRTPTINKDAGRDHWPGAATVLFAGGGLNVGQVIGATDSRAAFPTTRPYSPGDVLATIYDFLRIPTDGEFHDETGRPLPLLPEGRPIAELRA